MIARNPRDPYDTPYLALPGELRDEAAPRGLLAPTDAARFILAGNARITLVSKKTGARFTYRVRRAPDGDPNEYGRATTYFVSLLRGPDNDADYSYIGIIKDGWFKRTAKSRVDRMAPSFRAFEWTWNRLTISSQAVPADVEIWHEGACGRCGRALTVPESVVRGIGPDCWEMMGGGL